LPVFLFASLSKETDMLGNIDAVANLAVHDLDRARTFYAQTLGLTPIDSEGGEVVVFRSGNTRVLVYRSQFAGTNRATAVSWAVGDKLDEIVRQLRAKGVVFEHYDMPGITREGDIHRGGDMKFAWFKDPDGNILHLINR
jgi:catechol 2,3-dioxygenase-like lactoylglutathione lyase family enzyme